MKDRMLHWMKTEPGEMIDEMVEGLLQKIQRVLEGLQPRLREKITSYLAAIPTEFNSILKAALTANASVAKPEIAALINSYENLVAQKTEVIMQDPRYNVLHAEVSAFHEDSIMGDFGDQEEGLLMDGDLEMTDVDDIMDES